LTMSEKTASDHIDLLRPAADTLDLADVSRVAASAAQEDVHDAVALLLALERCGGSAALTYSATLPNSRCSPGVQ
jgi:hypothetical protein